MRELCLFDRIENATENMPAVAGDIDQSMLLENIIDNLRRILNSREGCCEIRQDYGMPDLNGLVTDFNNAINPVIRSVKYQIEKFEPRLTGVVVRHVPDPDNPLNVNFRITATVKSEHVSEKISFETILSDTGRVRIRS